MRYLVPLLLVSILASCASKTVPPSSLGIKGMDRPEFKRHWGAGEVKHLPGILNKDEVVKYVIYAGIQAVGNGLLIATDSRLLFVDKSRSGVTTKEFSYDKITYVSYKKGAVLGKMFLFEDGYRTVFQGLSNDEAEGFAQYITWFISESLGVDVSKKVVEDPPPADRQPPASSTGSVQGYEPPSITSSSSGSAGRGFRYHNVSLANTSNLLTGATGKGYMGEMSNVSGKDYSFVTFKLSIYGLGDKLLGVVSLTITDFAHGDTKTFVTIPFPGSESMSESSVRSYKIAYDSGVLEDF